MIINRSNREHIVAAQKLAMRCAQWHDNLMFKRQAKFSVLVRRRETRVQIFRVKFLRIYKLIFQYFFCGFSWVLQTQEEACFVITVRRQYIQPDRIRLDCRHWIIHLHRLIHVSIYCINTFCCNNFSSRPDITETHLMELRLTKFEYR